MDDSDSDSAYEGDERTGQLPSPPLNYADYEKKPLPPLPLHRRSFASSFSAEVSHALMPTMTASGSALDTNRPFLFDWEKEENGSSVRLYQGLTDPLGIIPLGIKQAQHATTIGAASFEETSRGSEARHPVLEQAAATEAAAAEANPAALQSSTAELTPLPVPTRGGPWQGQATDHHCTFIEPAAVNRIVIPTRPLGEILSPQPRSSAQRILKMAGDMSPTTAMTSLPPDTPTLHNSSSKIRQITGLDVGRRRPSQGEGYYSFEDEKEEAAVVNIAACPPDATEPGTYCREYSQLMSYPPSGWDYAQQYSYMDSTNDEIRTPLTRQEFTPTTTASPAFHQAHAEGEEHPPPPPLPAHALHFSRYEADAVYASPSPGGEKRTTSIPPETRHRRPSWHQHHRHHQHDYPPRCNNSDADSMCLSSSSSDVSGSGPEFEPTATELYHDTAASIARSSLTVSTRGRPRSSSSSSPPAAPSLSSPRAPPPPPPPLAPTPPRAFAPGLHHRVLWRSSSSNSHQPPADRTSWARSPRGPGTPDPTRPSSLNPFRRRDGSASSGLSERRGRRPAPLDAAAHRPFSSSAWKPPQRTPYPNVVDNNSGGGGGSSGIRATTPAEETGEGVGPGAARVSLLTRIFTGGGSGGGGGGIRTSFSVSAAGSPSRRGSAASWGPVEAETPGSAWSPDTPSPDKETFPNVPKSAAGAAAAAAGGGGGGGGGGLIARTLHHAKSAAGLRTRAERAERKRESLRGKIRVVRLPDGE